MSDFLALVVDDDEGQLHDVAKFLTAALKTAPHGQELQLAFLAPGFMYERAVNYPEYTAVWTTNPEGVLPSAFQAGHWVVFLPFIQKNPQHEGFLRNWTNRSTFLQSLSLIVMDCNLSGNARDDGAFHQGKRLLESWIKQGEFRASTMKVLYTANKKLDPDDLRVIQPAMTVGEKDLARLASVMTIEYEGHRSKLAQHKAYGLPLEYAAVHNSTSGADVGHGLSRSRELLCDESAKLQIAKDRIQRTRDRLGHLATKMSAAKFQTKTLFREATRVEAFLSRLQGIDLANVTMDRRNILAQFDSAFTDTVPAEAATIGSGRPLRFRREISSFENWRRDMCRVYLSKQAKHESWVMALRGLISDAGQGEFEVHPKTLQGDRDIEIFVPHEWLLELFAYLQDTRTFLKHFKQAPGKVRFVVRTDCWPQTTNQNGVDRQSDKVYKAGLIVGYDTIEFPDLTVKTVESLGKLFSGAFAVESLEYMYDLFIIRAMEEENGGAEVYEFDIARESWPPGLKPRRRLDGQVPIWSAGEMTGGGTFVPGKDLLQGQSVKLKSAIVFLFEGAMEGWCV